MTENSDFLNDDDYKGGEHLDREDALTYDDEYVNIPLEYQSVDGAV